MPRGRPVAARPANRYSSTVLAYSSAGMIVDAVNSVTRAPVWVRSTSVMTAPITAASTVAHDGPPVARGTWLHSWWPGSRRSPSAGQGPKVWNICCKMTVLARSLCRYVESSISDGTRPAVICPCVPGMWHGCLLMSFGAVNN